MEDILKSDSFLTTSKEIFSQLLLRDTLNVLEISLFKALLRWKEKNDVHAAKELAKLIRVPLIDVKEILNTVKPSKLVSEEVLFTSIAFHAAPEEYASNTGKMFQPRVFKKG